MHRRLVDIITAAVVIAIVAVALPMAALASQPSSNSPSTSTQKALAFAHCMRSHGVQRWPDPGANGQFDKRKTTLQMLGVSQSLLQTAVGHCQHLLPTNGQSAQAQNRQVLDVLLNFARCVRAHGVPNWPDPLAESDPGQPGTPGFPRSMPGINLSAPKVKDAMATCQHLMASIGYGSGGYP